MNTEITRAINKVGLTVKEKEPAIRAIGGGLAVLAGTVLACKGTVSVSDVIREGAKDISAMENSGGGDISEVRREVKVEVAKACAKNYALPSILIAGGLALGTSGTLMAMAEASASAAATMVYAKSFNDYRARVIQKYGIDADAELMGQRVVGDLTLTTVDEENNNVVVDHIPTIERDSVIGQPYSFWIDENSQGWCGTTRATVFMLRQYNRTINYRFVRKGYVTLNEVLDELKEPPVEEGGRIGWVYDPSNTCGSTYIDLGLYADENDHVNDILNETQSDCRRAIFIDLHPDGDIFKIMKNG